MSGYTPGEQPGSAERVVKLNTNENPFPPSDRVLKAIREIEEESLRRYPSPTAELFRAAAAKLHGVTPDMILCGNGSDDLLTVATRTFVPAGGKLAFPEPTYSLYPVLARLQDATAVPVPWGPDWSLPTNALLATKADAIYLANPNAPSGTFVSPMKVSELASRFPGLLLVDEAYADFADDNCVALLRTHGNVVITRTLSKAYSLAGLRFGYAIARADVVAEMMKVKDSYNTDAVSVIAATAAVEDQAAARESWEYVRKERARLTVELTEMGWTVLDSHANFILAASPTGDGKAAYEGLKQQGILVRYFDKPGLRDKIRVTVGQMHQNQALLAGIKKLAERAEAAERAEHAGKVEKEKAEASEKDKADKTQASPEDGEHAKPTRRAERTSPAAERADGAGVAPDERNPGRAVAGSRR
jgi:histidinol-phosphate aminotransferase